MESYLEVMTNEERLKAVMLLKLEKIDYMQCSTDTLKTATRRKERMCFLWPLQIRQGVTLSRTDISICRVVIVKHKLGG